MSAFARGFALGQAAYQQMLDNKDREERRAREAEEFKWRRDEQNRLAEARAREDAALAELANIQMGLQPATQAKITETYGMTPQQIAAAGTGLKKKLAEYDVPDSWDLQGGVTPQPSGDVAGAAAQPPGAAGLAPRRFTADQVEFNAPSPLDVERALGRVAIARRDIAGIRASLDRQQALELDGKRKEYLKRLENMSPEELAKELGGLFSADGSGVEAMLTWDPKGKQFLWASNIPGFPSRTLTKAELINGAMAVWERGNGDYNKGMQMLLDLVKTQRELQNADRVESIALAKNAAELDLKTRELESADRYRRAALDLQARQNARRELREFIDDKGNVVVLDISQLPVGENGVVSIPSGLRPKTARPDGEPGLTFNKLDDGGVFLDKRTGAPVGKLDPQLGIVPYGQDPRSDQRLLRTLQEKNIRIATGQTQDGLPTWVYITPSGRAFTTPEEALNPPIRQSDVEDLSGLRQLLDQTRAQLVAAGKSGDQRAIQPLARRVFELDRTLRAAARERFGERADEYLRDN